jgi:nicotinamide-nucleotide amidase
MKVEVVTVGAELLVSDVLDTSTAHLSRSLRALALQITCKVTVGDELELVEDVLRVALRRADVVLVVGGLEEEKRWLIQPALSQITDDTAAVQAHLDAPYTAASPPGLITTARGQIICLPGERQALAFLLETAVLPFLQQQIEAETQWTGWLVLRAVGVMESKVKQQLAELTRHSYSHIAFDSVAGQTSIRIWTRGHDQETVDEELARLRRAITEKLGDHVFGEGNDRLEDDVLQRLAAQQVTVAIIEGYTDRAMSRIFNNHSLAQRWVQIVPLLTGDDIADYLGLARISPDSDLTQWCRDVATGLRDRADRALGLFVYNNVTPGGIQVIVTLASSYGVSVTQRSFGGYPESINQWAATLALSHLRRWLLAHG